MVASRSEMAIWWVSRSASLDSEVRIRCLSSTIARCDDTDEGAPAPVEATPAAAAEEEEEDRDASGTGEGWAWDLEAREGLSELIAAGAAVRPQMRVRIDRGNRQAEGGGIGSPPPPPPRGLAGGERGQCRGREREKGREEE